MTSLTLSDIRAFVRAAIDELQVNESSYVPSDGGKDYSDDQDMNTIIDSKIVEAVTYVHKNAPLSLLLDAKKVENSDIKLDSEGTTAVIKISNMLRFVMLKAADAQKAVFDIVGVDDPIATMQGDKYTRGTYQRPVVVLSTDGTNKLLTYYSFKEKETSTTDLFEGIYYIPNPEINDTTDKKNKEVSICKDVKLAILNHIVGLVLLVYKDKHADSFFNQAKTYMQ